MSRKDEILRLHKNGWGIYEISKALDIPRNTVRYHIDPAERERLYEVTRKKRLAERKRRRA